MEPCIGGDQGPIDLHQETSRRPVEASEAQAATSPGIASEITQRLSLTRGFDSWNACARQWFHLTVAITCNSRVTVPTANSFKLGIWSSCCHGRCGCGEYCRMVSDRKSTGGDRIDQIPYRCTASWIGSAARYRDPSRNRRR